MKVVDVILREKHKKAPLGFFPYIEIGDINLSDKSYNIKNKGATNASILAGKGQLLISTVRPTRGAITIVREELVAASNAFVALEVDSKKCLTNFLFYQLNSQKFFNFLGGRSKGATYPTCAKGDIYNYEIKLPTLDEQERIVELLENLAIIIHRRRRQLQQLDTLVKAQFVEMFGEYKNEGKAIGEISNFCSRGKTPNYISTSQLKVINQACIYWDKIKFENVKYNDGSYVGDKILVDGDLLICSTGTGTLGRCNIFHALDKSRYMADSHVTILRLNNELLPIVFKTWLEQPKTQETLYSNCVSGSTNQIELSKEKFKAMKVLIPPLEFQTQFAIFVHQVDKSKFAIQKSLEKTQQLFDSLMQEYFG